MNCPHCKYNNTRPIKSTTNLGYKQYYCKTCCRQFNERTGTPLNFIEYPTEIVMLVIHYCYRFKVNLDDVVELMLLKGITLSHQTVSNWVQTFRVELGLKLRKARTQKQTKNGILMPSTLRFLVISFIFIVLLIRQAI